MTEEKKDPQDTQPEAAEPLNESQSETTETTKNTENTDTSSAVNEPATGSGQEAPKSETEEVGQTEENTSVLVPEGEALASISATEGTDHPAAEEESTKRGGSQVWIGISLLLAVLLVISLVKNPFGQSDAKTVVATVNGEDITKDKLYDKLVEAGGTQTLSGMIDEELVRQEMEKEKLQITDADIKKEKDFYLKQFGSDEALSQVLAQYGMSEEDFNEQLKKEAQIRKLLEPKVTVTDDEIKQYFEANKEAMNTPEQAKFSSILVATQPEAEAIIKELKGGADFAKLAKEKSIDTTTKDKGGDLGYVSKGTQDAAFDEAAFKLKKGEISGAIKSDAGFQVLKMTDYKQAHTATLEEKKAEIKDMIVTQKVSEKATTWLADLKSKAKITNTLENKANEKAAAAPAK
ncbi:peptidylprolyl isomerase [Paenibacillus sp. CAA11]|uniref:peptidyl-prolyl cis-trans isomerase n=1 Tax=Paenibacillus sp. CAA11 TaxID=1532905 RepID=UPI000D3A04B3|nr:peptidyl-prolyl cis-trans isomerase [Paenibacillus sp. CAA11]AWB45790.1 peptidylprolyl isomerase [Paenibacillus sp. CAA11]